MDYEKAYKESLERATKLAFTGNISAKAAGEIFPELRESEDDRIRKYIIWHLKHTRMYPDTSINNHVEEAIAWLEKKGCKVDVLDDFPTEFERQISHLIASSINKEWEYTSDFVKWTANALLNYAKHELEKQGELKPTDYHLANEKMEIERWKEACKAACSDRNYRSHYGLTETRDDYFVDGVQWADENPKHKPVWSEEDEKILKELVEEVKDQLDSVPSPDCMDKEDEKVLKQLNKWMNWLKSLKDRVQPQPKQEWSEEDEKMFDKLYEILYIYGYSSHPEIDLSSNEAINLIYWLKSIKPSHWKPTKEQLRAIINSAQGLYQCKEKEVLLDLYEQLKNF